MQKSHQNHFDPRMFKAIKGSYKLQLTDKLFNKFQQIFDIYQIKDILQMDSNYFPSGTYYMIICLDGNQALRIQEKQVENYSGSRLVNIVQDAEDNGQIFMVERTGKDDTHFEIINCVSNKVFESELLGQEIKLHSGKHKDSQIFKIQPAPMQADSQYFWITQGKRGLSLEGILRIEDHSPNSEKQLFRFVKVANTFIRSSALVVNNLSGKAIDIPHSTRKHGEALHQWKKNNRWNQRWHFEKIEGGIIIRNIFNGLCLDVSGQKTHSGSKVVQWEKNGGANQLWEAEPCGKGLFKFRSVLNRQLCLAVKKGSVEDGGELEVSSEESPSMYWKVLIERDEPYEEDLVLDIIFMMS